MTDENNSEETALAKPEVTLETMQNAHNSGTLQRARDSRSGKFVRTAEAHAVHKAKTTQKFLNEMDPESGLSRHETMLQAAYDGLKLAATEPKALGAVAKIMERLDEESGSAKVREEMLRDKSHVHQSVRVVMVPVPTLMNPEVLNFEEEQKRRLEEHNRGPAFAEVVSVRTNE